MLRPIDHDIFVPAGDCASQPGAAETLRRLFLSQCSSRTPTAATIHRQPIRSGCNTPPCSSSRRIWQTAPWRSADAEIGRLCTAIILDRAPMLLGKPPQLDNQIRDDRKIDDQREASPDARALQQFIDFNRQQRRGRENREVFRPALLQRKSHTFQKKNSRIDKRADAQCL